MSLFRSTFNKANFKGLFPLFLFALFVPTAEAFPDLIRKGYQSCVSCHISPTGGGALTTYGRSLSEEISMFPLYEGSGQLAGIPEMENLSDATGLFQAVKVNLQADYRSAFYQTPGATPPFDQPQSIQMEKVLHTAFHIGKTTDLVASYGQYGNDAGHESRTHYIQIRTSKYLSLRWGRFFPAYGINFDDHTLLTRSGVGVSQGREIFGLEAHYDDDDITATVTRVLGESVEIVDSNDRLVFNGQDTTGFLVRAGWKLGARHIAGASFAHNRARSMLGGWFQTAPIKDLLYVMADLNQVSAQNKKRLVGLIRAGTEPIRGVTASVDAEIETGDDVSRNRLGVSVQVIPIPHVEVRSQARRDSESGLTTFVFMGHFWL